MRIYFGEFWKTFLQGNDFTPAEIVLALEVGVNCTYKPKIFLCVQCPSIAAVILFSAYGRDPENIRPLVEQRRDVLPLMRLLAFPPGPFQGVHRKRFRIEPTRIRARQNVTCKIGLLSEEGVDHISN